MSMRVSAVLLAAGAIGALSAKPVWVSLDGTKDPTPPSVTIVSAGKDHVTFHVATHGMYIRDTVIGNAEYRVLSFPGEGTTVDVGLPELPQVTRVIGCARGAAIQATIKTDNEVQIESCLVFPVQPSYAIGGKPAPFCIDSAFYATSSRYVGSGDRVTASGQATWRDIKVAIAAIRPLQYDPAQRRLHAYCSVTATYTFAGGECLPAAVTPSFYQAYSMAIVNFHYLGVSEDWGSYPPRFLFLIPEASFTSDTLELRPLWTWKAMLGYHVDYDIVGPDYIHNDTQLIRQRILDYYNAAKNLGADCYVALVGGNNGIKVPKGWSQHHPDATGTWSDHAYACVGDTDDIADLGLGRILDPTSEVSKILKYERDQAADWPFQKVLLVNDMTDGDSAQQDIVERYLIRQNIPHARQDGRCNNVNNSTLDSAIEQGCGVLDYFGDGSNHNGWSGDYWPYWDRGYQDYANENIGYLDNSEYLPMVYEISCWQGCVGDDQYSTQNHCFAWSSYGHGGVAAWGFPRPAWHEAASVFETLLIRVPVDSNLHNTCLIATAAEQGLRSQRDDTFSTDNIRMFTLMGDPTLNVNSADSGQLGFSVVPSFLREGVGANVTVTVTKDGNPVVGAQVGFHQEGGILEGHPTGSSGITVAYVIPNSTCSLEVSIFKPNYRTQLFYIPVLPSGWTELESLPASPSGRPIKDGGCMAYDAGTDLIYASKGNKTGDFYSYDVAAGTWTTLTGIPLGAEEKQAYKGSVVCSDGNGKLYLTKGNNTVGFWGYQESTKAWTQLTNIPTGSSGKKVKQGAGLAWATKNGKGYAYLLKGYRNEFYKYDPATNSWTGLLDAPIGIANHLKYDAGSWLVSDGGHLLYAFKAKYHEFYLYDANADTWSQAKTPMPIHVPGSASNKKAKDGSCAAWFGDKLYAFKGGNTTEFYCYFPTGDSWQKLEDIPLIGTNWKRRKVMNGAALAGDPGEGVYAFKGNKSLELWRYLPCWPSERDAASLDAIGGNSVAATGGPSLGGEQSLTDGLEVSRPRWNSQGTMICYSRTDTLSEREQVYQCHYGISTPEQRVVNLDEDCEEPVYSPNGLSIAFQLDDTASGFYQLCVTPATGLSAGGGGTEVAPVGPDACTDAAGTTAAEAPASAASPRLQTGGGITALGVVSQITHAAADHCCPEWSLNGQWLCYERDDANGYTQIWRVPAAGGTEQQLTFGNSDHFLPSYLNANEIVFTLSPDTGYDKIAKVNVSTQQVTVLSSIATDHDQPNPSWNGVSVTAEALDGSGNTQIVRMAGSGGSESWLTSGSNDIMEPDYSQDNQSIFAVRWTGITSQIVWVDALNGGYAPVTDSLAIRDNPDAHYNSSVATSIVAYEREAWNPGSLLFGGGRYKHGSGVYLSKFRRYYDDGTQGASLGVFALDKAKPNPATGKVTIRWQVPVEADVSLCVYNTAGQLVKVLADGRCKPGAYTSVWNGTDANGRRLANGVYFYALDNGVKRINRKVVLTE